MGYSISKLQGCILDVGMVNHHRSGRTVHEKRRIVEME
jgi:hypothetical protein